jgi:GNAT superfamily N-acetyltransferase
MMRSRNVDTLVMKATTTFYRRMNLMLRPFDEPIPEPRPKGKFVIREMTPSNKDALLEMLPERRKVVDDRLRRGARCFLAWDDDRLAHARWVAADRVRIDYLERNLVLGPEDVYTFDSYTRPPYRGRGLAQAVGLHLLKIARDEGRRRAWSLPAVENAAGMRVLEAIGYRRTGILRYVRLGPYRRYWREVWIDGPAPKLEAAPKR